MVPQYVSRRGVLFSLIHCIFWKEPAYAVDMKITKLFALPAVVTLALIGAPSEPSGLSFTCSDGTTAPTCPAGPVHFTGTGYNNHTKVVVIAPGGEATDDGFYQAPGGELSFTETLNPPGDYTIELYRKGGKELFDSITVTTY